MVVLCGGGGVVGVCIVGVVVGVGVGVGVVVGGGVVGVGVVVEVDVVEVAVLLMIMLLVTDRQKCIADLSRGNAPRTMLKNNWSEFACNHLGTAPLGPVLKMI